MPILWIKNTEIFSVYLDISWKHRDKIILIYLKTRVYMLSLLNHLRYLKNTKKSSLNFQIQFTLFQGIYENL